MGTAIKIHIKNFLVIFFSYLPAISSMSILFFAHHHSQQFILDTSQLCFRYSPYKQLSIFFVPTSIRLLFLPSCSYLACGIVPPSLPVVYTYTIQQTKPMDYTLLRFFSFYLFIICVALTMQDRFL